MARRSTQREYEWQGNTLTTYVKKTRTGKRKDVTREARTSTDFGVPLSQRKTSASGVKTKVFKKGKKAGTTKVKPLSTRRAASLI